MNKISRQKIKQLFSQECATFDAAHPQSKKLSQRATEHLMFGVPMHWMNDWSTPFNLYVQSASGATLTDVDGHTLTDFCLGDTGAMFGHSPAPVASALREQASNGYTTMLPTENAVWVAEELARRFGLPFWQFAMTATDANRFVLRWVRAATQRKKILVFNGCYHGTVDDVFVDLVDGQPQQRDSLLGQVYDLTQHTVVIEFNDLAALETALAKDDIACVIAEPVMTNIGMVLPQAGFWEAAQQIIRRHNTMLVMDETHTISSGPGGYARANRIDADAIVIGKPIGGGVPCAVYGFNASLAERAQTAKQRAAPGHSGIGTTLSANMLAVSAMRATLEHVMTDAAYAQMFVLAEKLAGGLRDVIAKYSLPWCVTQVGARVEFQFSSKPPTNGTEAANMFDHPLERMLHLYLLNRGILITPFHNMMLVCAETTSANISELLEAFDLCLAEITN
ncbi:MAG: aspartate aminotransferase family protein [Burkholderiales bacterium]